VPAPFHGSGERVTGYRFLRRLYRRAEAPIIIEDAYLDQALRRAIGEAKLKSAPLLALIDALPDTRIGRADETVRFGIADTEISSILEIPLNASVAIIHQSVFGEASQLLYESCAFLRGDIALMSEPIKFADRAR
jgi:DNA-binding GntR family transcriptional regulator